MKNSFLYCLSIVILLSGCSSANKSITPDKDLRITGLTRNHVEMPDLSAEYDIADKVTSECNPYYFYCNECKSWPQFKRHSSGSLEDLRGCGLSSDSVSKITDKTSNYNRVLQNRIQVCQTFVLDMAYYDEEDSPEFIIEEMASDLGRYNGCVESAQTDFDWSLGEYIEYPDYGGYFDEDGTAFSSGNPNEQDRLDIVPLALIRDPASVKKLVAAGADLSDPSIFLRTRSPEVVKALIDAGAKPNDTLRIGPGLTYGFKPLMAAYSHKVIDVLLDAKADVNASNPRDKDKTPLIYSVANNWYSSRLDIYRDCHPDDTGKAVCNFSSQALAVKSLLAAKPNLEARTYLGETALMYAANAKLTQMLLAAGADVHARDYRRRTPIMFAADADSVNILIAAGADIHAVDRDGANALMLVQDPSAVKALLAAGVDVNAKDKNGKTALMHFRSPEIFNILIAAGADVKVKDNDGKTAISYISPVERPRFNRSMLSGDLSPTFAPHENMLVDELLMQVPSKEDRDQNIKSMIEAFRVAGYDMNTRDNSGVPAYLYNKHLSEYIDFLQIDVNQSDDQGRTLIMHSVSYYDWVKALLDHGANVNQSDIHGKTPLMYSAFVDPYSKSNLVKLMINNGADVNDKDDQGRTPLMYLVMSDVSRYSIDGILKSFAEKDGDLNAQDNEGKTVLMYAAESLAPKGDAGEVVKALIEFGSNLNIRDNQGKTALEYANSSQVIDALLDAKANVPASIKSDIALYRIKDLASVKAAIAAGADVNKLDHHGFTPLMRYLNRKDIKDVELPIVEELIKAGTNINIQCPHSDIDSHHSYPAGQTALSLAVEKAKPRSNYIKVVEMLIAAGADVHLRIEHLGSDKSILPFVKSEQVAQILVNAGMKDELNEIDDEGQTVINKIDDPAVRKVFINAGAQESPINPELISGHDEDKLKVLIKKGLNVNAKDTNGMTPLMYAYNCDEIPILIDAGADVNARDNNGKTVLMHAGKDCKIELLLAAGVDVNARDNEGKTALMYSSRDVATWDDSSAFLIAAGADVNARDNNGKTPLMYAKSALTAHRLIEAGADIYAADNDGRTVAEYFRAAYDDFKKEEVNTESDSNNNSLGGSLKSVSDPELKLEILMNAMGRRPK